MKIIKCDRCKEEVSNIEYNYTTIRHEFGFGSIYDEQTLVVDLCEDCLIQLFKEYF